MESRAAGEFHASGEKRADNLRDGETKESKLIKLASELVTNRSNMTLGQPHNDGVFVWVVLVQRPDRDPGDGGNFVRGRGRIPLGFENVSCRVEDPIHRLSSPELTWSFARLKRSWVHKVRLPKAS
jgi:hypothetical protein